MQERGEEKGKRQRERKKEDNKKKGGERGRKGRTKRRWREREERERREEGLHLNSILFMISSELSSIAFTPVLGTMNKKMKGRIINTYL